MKRTEPGGADRTKFRARLKLLERRVKGRDGELLLCADCEGKMNAYELIREAEKAKVVVCCTGKRCGASAKATARIFRASLVEKKA